MSQRPSTYSEIESMQDIADQIDCVYRSDHFWFGCCGEGGCRNLHVFFRRDGYPYEVGVTFTCEQLERMLSTARLIEQHHRN